jgi:NTP pyrophosphatase (non-canonical NTP hydrolase)
VQYHKQSDTSFEAINQMVWEHLEARDWLGNTPRSYATAIAVEAAELLEHYQFSEKAVGDKQALASELADILIYCFQFAMHTDIDMAQAIKDKLAEAAKKYPADQLKGKTIDEQREVWMAMRNNHRAARKGL